jgi:curved DNA-binding protein CbpA
MKNYYEILEISENATEVEIQQSYKRLMLRWHPDRAKPEDRTEAEEKAKLINEARDVLGDPAKRSAYDRTRTMGFDDGDYRDLFSYYNVPMNIDMENGAELFGLLAGLFRQMTNTTSGASPAATTTPYHVVLRVFKPFYSEKILRFLLSFGGATNIQGYRVDNRFFTRQISFSFISLFSGPELVFDSLRRIPTLRVMES